MDKQQYIRQQLQEIAEQAVPNNLNPWSTIHARIQTSAMAQPAAKTSRVRFLWAGFTGTRRVSVLAGILVMALLVGTVMSAPAAQAAVALIFERFGISFIDTTQFENTQTVMVEPTKSAAIPWLSLAEAQQQASFTIQTPQWLPNDLAFIGALVNHDPVQPSGQYDTPTTTVWIRYAHAAGQGDPNEEEMSLEIVSGPNASTQLLPCSREQQVTVRGQPATYVRGAWRDDGQGDPQTAIGDLRWDDTFESAWLSWEEDGLRYTLSAYDVAGLDDTTLFRVAESLR
ncbi:MAG: hypothetical protein MI924_04480 [Chloroflexales bacterium]|nr:hypothetical protein [Chloroflexales bacterium]